MSPSSTLRVLAVSVAANLVLGLTSLGIVFVRPEPRVIMVSADGAPLEELPLQAQPIINNASILVWTNRAVAGAYTFNFESPYEQLDLAKNSFTPEAWDAFVAAIKRTGVLDTVIAQKLSVTATIRAAPLVHVSKNDRWTGLPTAWSVEVPLVVSYVSLTERRTENMMAQATVVKRAPVDSPDGSGLGLGSLVVSTWSGADL